MIKFEVRTADTLDDQVVYRFDVGVVDEWTVCAQLQKPFGEGITKEDLARICFQFADHLTDQRFSNGAVQSAELISELLEENSTLKNLFETRE